MQQKIASIYNLITPNSIAKFTIIIGIALAAFQIQIDRSLWLDEAMLVNNVIQRNFFNLYQPLTNYQIAPIGYLYILKIVGFFTNYHSITLRSVSLIGYIGSLYFGWKFIRIIVKNQIASYLFLVTLVLNPILLYYATEIKPYIFDVLTTIVILYYTIIAAENNNKLFLLSIIFSTCIFFSQIAIFLLPGSFIYLYFNTDIRFMRTLYVSMYAKISFILLVYYFLFLNQHPAVAHLTNYWKSQNAFLSLQHLSKSYNKLKQILPDLFLQVCNTDYTFVIITIAYLSGQLILIWTKKYRLLILLTLPICIHLLLASFQIYPIESRLVIYSIPIITTFFTILFGKLFYNLKLSSPFFLNLLLIAILLFGAAKFFQQTDFPFQQEEIKPAISFFKKNVQPNENIYLYYAAKPAFDYYQNFKNYKIDQLPIEYGNTNYTSFMPFEQELSTLPIGKNWLLLTHEYHGEIAHTIDYIQTHFKLLKIYHTKGAWLLYFEKL